MASYLMNFDNQEDVLVLVTNHVKRRFFSDLYVIERSYLYLLNILGFVCCLVSQVDFINPWMRDTRRVKNP